MVGFVYRSPSEILTVVGRLQVTGTLTIGFEPTIVATDLVLGPDSITTITATDSSTLFIVVEGTANVDGTLVVDLSGRDYNATYTTISVIRASQIVGGFSSIQVGSPIHR